MTRNILVYFWVGITDIDTVEPCEIHEAAALWESHHAIRWQEQLFLPHSSRHLICFYSLYTYPHFTCQGGRKTYKCQGTTETTITAVCAHVWTVGLPFARNMKITPFVTHNMLPLHTPCQDTWASLSTGVSHITLNEQKSLFLPVVALACHAECSVTVYAVKSPWHKLRAPLSPFMLWRLLVLKRAIRFYQFWLGVVVFIYI